MLKHLPKSLGILLMVFLTSSAVTAQTTVTINNDNADCEFDYKIYHNDGTCSGTLVLISGTCSGSSTCYETIPIGKRLNRIVVIDGANNTTVYNPNCGSTSGSYTNCDSNTSNVDLNYGSTTLTVWD